MATPRQEQQRGELDRITRGARECGFDPLLDNDDLAPARPLVWLVWGFVVFAIAMVLTGCGGGIDTPEEVMGPPEPTSKVAPPRPCPVDVSACRSEPTPG